MGGFLVADKTIVCPIKGSGVAVSGANRGLDGIATDAGAHAGIALSQIDPNILEPGCHGGLAAAASSTNCPNNRAHVETSAATHVAPGISTDAGAHAGIALA